MNQGLGDMGDYKNGLMKMCCIALVLINLLTLGGCSKKGIVHVTSPDRDQDITIITKGEVQYLVNGKSSTVPDSDYIKLDISEKDIEVDNALNICWEEASNGYAWDAVIDNARILELKMDTTKFRFNTKLPTKNNGIPTEMKFRKDYCATISLILERSTPPSNTHVEFK